MKKLPIIKQAQVAECGYACIAMIAQYHGHQIDLADLRTMSPPAMRGSTMLDLVTLLEHLKLSARAYKLDLKSLGDLKHPAILHWNMNHFVVLKSVHQQHICIHDPAYGERKVSWDEASQSFTGIVLVVEKADDFSAIQTGSKLRLFDLFKQVQGIRKNLTVLLILSLAIELFVLLNPLLIQYVTDGAVNSNRPDNLYVIAAAFLLLTLCHTGIEWMRSHFVIYLSNKMGEYFLSGVMHHLLLIPYTYFESRHKGDILSRFHAINEIQSKVTTDSINTLLDGLVILLTLVIMFIYSAQLTLLVLLSLGGYLGIRLFAYRHHKLQIGLSITEHANKNSKFLEIVQNILSIKLYGKEKSMYKSWQNHLVKAMNADIQTARASVSYNLASLFLFNFEHIFVISIGALFVMHNQFSVGMLMAFLAYRQTFVNKSSSFIQKIVEYQLLSVQLERVADILVQPQERQDEPNGQALEIRGDIKVKDVGYQYSQNQNQVLNKVNLHIQPGEKVAITGASGVGKTTLMKMMLGLIVPTQGEILIDDIPLALIGLEAYRKITASVMQGDSLISGSILENISFMDAKVDLSRMIEAARMAQIHEDILNMTMGYETLIGDMGSTLSGGQKQRILLARALYRNPKILFLDEATSHLDVDTEIEINRALKKMNITQIIIAHRPESIKMADRVIHIGLNGHP